MEKEQSKTTIKIPICLGLAVLSVIFQLLEMNTAGYIILGMTLITGVVEFFKEPLETWKGWWRVTVGAVCLGIIIFSYLLIMLLSVREGYTYRIGCASNLKQIGLAMKEYSGENDGWFPNKDGVAGLEMLRKKYLRDSKVFICLSSRLKPAEADQPLTPGNVSYDYKGGLRETPENADVPLAWDKSKNHKKFGNTLYCDGHVQGITAENWFEEARKGE